MKSWPSSREVARGLRACQLAVARDDDLSRPAPRNGAGHTDSAADESFGGIPELDFDQSRPSGEDESSA
jgi:hypothetical protein